MLKITDFINEDHDGFYYEPDTGRLFKIEEIVISREDIDGKVRSYQKKFKSLSKCCTHIIYFIMTGKWVEENKLIDHIDNNPWNNKWGNLREATYQQNSHNRQSRGRWKHYDLGLEMGVEVTPGNRYRVKVCGKHLGTFDTVEQANNCALKGRKAAYGEFDYYNGEPT